MTEKTQNLLDIITDLVMTPKFSFAVRGNIMSQRLHMGGARQGAKGLLVVLWQEDGLTNSEIAEKLDIKPSSVTNMVKQLEKEKLIKKVQDEEDRRISRIYLTDKGKDLKKKQKNMINDVSEEIFSSLTVEEMESFYKISQKLIEANKTDEDHKYQFGRENFSPNEMRAHMRKIQNEERRRMRDNESFEDTISRFNEFFKNFTNKKGE